jgi:hypothetical protein
MPKPKGLQRLINTAEVKRVLLRIAERERPGWKFTRVSSRMLNTLDSKIRLMLVRAVKHHPSMGKTLDWDFTEVI